MSFKVNVYDPTGQTYAPRIKHDDWERHRTVISALHAAKTPRKVMLKQLRDQYDFTPTLGQLQAKCKEWNLKVYAKESPMGSKAESSGQQARLVLLGGDMTGSRSPPPRSPAYYMAAESGFVEEWSDDYRVHPSMPVPMIPMSPLTPPRSSSPPDNDNNSRNSTNNVPNNNEPTTTTTITNPTTDFFPDRSLPSEYIGGGLLANSADSHWPIPESPHQATSMLQAAHYYHAVAAFQQSFSIYRAVYLYQRRHYPPCDVRLITTILQCCCAAVTDHQRNIMHSVLHEIGSLKEIDALHPLLLDCLQSASLNMISADASCDVDSLDLYRARANAYVQILMWCGRGDDDDDDGDVGCLSGESLKPPFDLQVSLYKFEHALLMHEHDTRILQKLLGWCELAVERLHHDMDDIFVGQTVCGEEYYRRVSQILSGYLLSQWLRHPLDYDDLRLQVAQSAENPLHPIQFKSSTAQILAALAFMVVDAIQCDPLAVTFGRPSSEPAGLWFPDAAKMFKRGARMLCRLDERSRCALFTDAFLERFYTSLSYRQRSYRWAGQLPAIVDSVGISLAQQSPWFHELDLPATSFNVTTSAVNTLEEQTEMALDGFEFSAPTSEEPINNSPCIAAEMTDDVLLPDVAPSPTSECNSIASFMNTYRRTLKLKFDARSKSGGSTPGDLMSLSSSTDFRFGLVTGGNTADGDSLWHILVTNETCAAV